MIDLGTGNNNKINWAMNDKQEFIDIVETVYRGARKGRGLVVSPKGEDRGWAVGERGAATCIELPQTASPYHDLARTRAPDTHTFPLSRRLLYKVQVLTPRLPHQLGHTTSGVAHLPSKLNFACPLYCPDYLSTSQSQSLVHLTSCTLLHTHTQKWWPYWMLQDDMSQVRGA